MSRTSVNETSSRQNGTKFQSIKPQLKKNEVTMATNIMIIINFPKRVITKNEIEEKVTYQPFALPGLIKNSFLICL